MKYNEVAKIREHYDLASPLYQKLWGNHIHHGYWQTGKETKEVASQNLIQLLVDHASIRKGSRILDVGCGVGGTSIWFAKNMDCKVKGVTISPVQVEMATKAAAQLSNKPIFLVDDANDLQTKGTFDVVWAVEMISHLKNRAGLFERISALLPKGGRICITDWMKDDHISRKDEESYIHPIEEGMLVDLPNLTEYKKHIDDNGLRLVYYEDISSKVSKTWDISLDIIKDRALWSLARDHSKEFISFLKSFKSMRNGFKTGTFRYGAMVIEKP